MSDLQRGFADRIKRLVDDGSWDYVDATIGMCTDALERYLEGDFDTMLGQEPTCRQPLAPSLVTRGWVCRTVRPPEGRTAGSRTSSARQ